MRLSVALGASASWSFSTRTVLGDGTIRFRRRLRSGVLRVKSSDATDPDTNATVANTATSVMSIGTGMAPPIGLELDADDAANDEHADDLQTNRPCGELAT